MAVTRIPAIIRIRRGSYTQWYDSNPVLQEGEMSLITSGQDVNKFKVGNGIIEWRNLPYIIGADGKAATVEIIATENLPAGSQAEVTNEGTGNESKLRFKIPKGDKGETGDAATIQIIDVITLEPNEQAEVINDGNINNAELIFKIPKGDKGETGDAATIEIDDVETLLPTEQAEVINTGDEYNAKLLFKLPQGNPGTIVPDITGLIEKEIIEDDDKFYIYDDSDSSLKYITGSKIAPIDSPTFIGEPTAPTANVGTNSTQLATTEYADRASHPINSYYTQYAGANNTFDANEAPGVLFGGTWTLLWNTEGTYFQTEGGGSMARTSGLQEDGIREIYGKFRPGGGTNPSSFEGPCTVEGAFGVENVPSAYRLLGSSNTSYILNMLNFYASRVTPVDNRVHPRNRLIRIYKRSA